MQRRVRHRLRPPPLTLSKRESSRSVKKSVVLASFRMSALSLEKAKGNDRHFSAPFSLVSKSRFPETETPVAETGSTESLLSGEAEYLALARPFGRKIEQPGDPHAMR